MGKKRIAVIGDIESEEEVKKQRDVAREQKKFREQAASPQQESHETPTASDLKPKPEPKKQEKEKVHISGLKGGERVKSLDSEMQTEADLVARKLAEADSALTGKTTVTPKAKTPKKRGKNYLAAKIKLDPTKKYSLDEAVRLLKDMPRTKFASTVELHINTLDKLSTTTSLPHSTGRSKKAAIADDATVSAIESGKIDFDILFATADQMPRLAKLAKTLGPKGLMPNPKTGTVVTNPAKAIEEYNSSEKISLKTEQKNPVIHTVVGKLTQAESELVSNTQAVVTAVKPVNIRSIYLKSTMSPSIKLSI